MQQQSKIIRPKQLAQLLGVSTATIWRWRQEELLPRPIQLGPRLIGWQRETIENWLAQHEKAD